MSANFPSISATRINRHWGLATLGCVLATIIWLTITDVTSSISAWHSTWTESASLAQHGIPRVCPVALPPILVIPVNARSAGPRMCKTLLAALVHGYSPVIINWESDKSGGAAQIEKVEAMQKFLQTPRSTTGALIEDESLVFMIDGLDVWLQLPPPHLVARFRELVPVDHEGVSLKVVIGSDKKCWPNDQNGETCRGVPDSTVPRGSFGPLDEPDRRPRWANSGTIMGEAQDLRQLYADLMERLREGRHQTDQGVFNDILAARGVALDYWYRLFYADAEDTQNLGVFNIPSAPFLSVPPSAMDLDSCIAHTSDFDPPYHLLPRLIVNERTGQVPVAAHFNDGHSKSSMETLWSQAGPWFANPEPRFQDIVRERLERAGDIELAHNGTFVPFDALCPGGVEALQ